MTVAKISCFFSTSGHSGVDRIMQRLLPAMAARGHEITLLKLQDHGPHLESSKNLSVVELRASHVSTSLGELVNHLKEWQPNVLFTDKDKVNRMARRARNRAGTDTRLIMRNGTTVSVDLAQRKPFDRWLQRRSMRLTYADSDAALMPSRGAADDFISVTGLQPERVQVVPSPVVCDELFELARQPVEHHWLKDKQYPVILGVGELCVRKDFETLIRAFAYTRTHRPARLIILGRGKRRERLMALADELGVAEDVDLPGFDPNPYRYMRRADAFALSSRWEGLGLVLVEALALGLPVVATDCPSGPQEILQGGRIGPLVPVGDDRALATGLASLLDNPPDKKLMQAAVAPYHVRASTSAYLEAMGLDTFPQ
ncbi:glycosyltransferase [Ectothiorhodospira mobilis]|uniref:glycosyltransferase n=1 Tax=Ectothiorhodospira mobilis TaxID=195064 RepID=UPI001908327F|nr:glycosyltransferase [Ectothiorhodospira mobilis]MBK1691829.1 glycosyl transferase [Ectothiorhodospira mobilis]